MSDAPATAPDNETPRRFPGQEGPSRAPNP